MASADVDTGFLSAHLGLPEQILSSVVSEPTVDLVKAVLQAVIAKAQEFNELSSDRLRLDIELESTIRSSEARSESFKATAEKALKDVEELRQKLRSEGTDLIPLGVGSPHVLPFVRANPASPPQKTLARRSRTSCSH